jgi:hypothetical protein
MLKREVIRLPLLLLAGFACAQPNTARSLTIDSISNSQMSQGLKVMLEKSALAAIGNLGQTNGFMGNDLVKIALPAYLQDGAKLLRTLGQGARLDALVANMNHAAELAVPQAKDLLVSTVKAMNIKDAKNIVAGGTTSVTQFFAEKTRGPLTIKFLPIVSAATAHVGLAEQYNQLAGKAAAMGLISGNDVSIERYVSAKALDGLYLMIAEEEKKIRLDPIGSGSAILQKVFGALR